MSVISTSGIPATPVAPGSQDTSVSSSSSQTRVVAKAVRDLNTADYAGTGREVNLSIDRATRQPVVTVVDAETRKVITQWPTQYLLDLAAEINTHKIQE